MLKKLLITFLIFAVPLNFALAQENKEKIMTREEVCIENFHKLFNSEPFPKGNDEEMMEILQKYIFGEIFTVGNLDMKQREMITVVSLATMQTLPQLKGHMNAALNVGVTPVELKESIYLCAPFIGFPKTLNALTVLNEVFKERQIKTPLEHQTTVKENERYQKGYEIQNPSYGDEIKTALQGLPNNMGDEVARFLTEVCFGDFYTRSGLDIKTKEMLGLIILIANNAPEATIKSHIKGSMKAGNSKETIASSIIQAMPYVGFPSAINSLKILKGIN